MLNQRARVLKLWPCLCAVGLHTVFETSVHIYAPKSIRGGLDPPGESCFCF